MLPLRQAHPVCFSELRAVFSRHHWLRAAFTRPRATTPRAITPRALLLLALLLSALLLSACSKLPESFTFDGSNPVADAGDLGSADMCGVPVTCDVSFVYLDASATSVELHGSFNSWKSGLAMEKDGTSFSTVLTLTHGAHLEYKFFVDGTTWVPDPQNPDTTGPPYDNSVLTVSCLSTCADSGPPPDGGPDSDGAPTPVFDWRDGVMYFVLVDRFLDGDSSNNKPESGVELAANFQGGDLAGVLAKLQAGYFTQLGVNVIWLSSPVDAPDGKYAGQDGHDHTGYHGYWPRELDQVESQVGSLTLLKLVVSEAHKRGIRVVLDYVMNHVHDSSTVYKNHPTWFWPLDMSGTQCICGKGCSWAPPQGLRCWFDPFLPAFDFGDASARKFSVDNAMQWIADTAVDGFRLDAVKHIEQGWLTDLRQRINSAVAGRFYLVGETFDGDRSLVRSFVDPATKLDGQFDFSLRAELVKVILMRQGSFADLDLFLTGNDGYYGAGAVMATFLGNHDLPRAIHLAEDSPQFSEWDTGKSRAWSNQPTAPGYDRPYQRLALAFVALMTLRGLPTLYYGDEIGMAGGGDPDNRRFMSWSGTCTDQDALRDRISKLTTIRTAHPALRRGTRQQVWLSADVYAYRMTQGSDDLTVVLNRSDNEQTIQLSAKASYVDLLTGETVTAAAVKVTARGARILQ